MNDSPPLISREARAAEQEWRDQHAHQTVSLTIGLGMAGATALAIWVLAILQGFGVLPQ